ncbi:Na-translocating system protein MpsC family protein [Clostridium felsineum]|uniref:Uncharacterized protein n=1 Tax=Clostridium felsineum TaxID=36839 RepID=A0A1S8L1F1_9CLOT|nr:Na-translocating system protein MpsC family protein [Clostridium felsineum]MCR3760474.1 DUF2294 domain-containing protein [Clostridium felsineum]URZ08805.1 hypothetical protein CLROS_041990 [Clostridium felsineum]URZ09433.1 hypothetical protein CROST_001040 [Clostridium felsineum]URZ14211.1 hypothetical protein CLFE_001960 [Clostridium felsineum DSM 794]
MLQKYEKTEFQERIKRLVVKIVKHYRGKGPDYVKVKIIDDNNFNIEIKGILSNLSEILVDEGATDLVTNYWKVMKPHLEKSFYDDVKAELGQGFQYAWKIYNFKNKERTIEINIKLI